MALERLQKVVARAGVASRRKAETLITEGKVRVNGIVVTELGTKVDPRKDKVEVGGKRLFAEDFVYIVLHKPRDVVSTVTDPEGRKTVTDCVEGVDARLFPVGRLDYATSGVLLLTNDGSFSQALLHPTKKVPKTYVMKLDGLATEAMMEKWATGVDLEDGRTRPADVRKIRNERGKSWIEITISEGRNQQLRRMAEATGAFVMRLARTAFAGITSEGLRPGQWRPLSVDELKALKRTYGVPQRVRAQRALFSLTNRQERKKKGGPREKKSAGSKAAKSTGSGRRSGGASPKASRSSKRSGGAAGSSKDRKPTRGRRGND